MKTMKHKVVDQIMGSRYYSAFKLLARKNKTEKAALISAIQSLIRAEVNAMRGAKGVILDYLNRQNRPYSAIDIFNNLHKEYGKTLVVRSLEELAQEGSIKDKTYGKQKVYVADQNQLPAVDENEMKAMDLKITTQDTTLKTEQEEAKKMETELLSLQSSLTTTEARQQLQEIQNKISTTRQRLTTIKDSANSVSPEQRAMIMGAREKYVKQWRKRKRMAKDILDSILEGYPKSKKELFEDIGIETDEDYDVKPPDI